MIINLLVKLAADVVDKKWVDLHARLLTRHRADKAGDVGTQREGIGTDGVDVGRERVVGMQTTASADGSEVERSVVLRGRRPARDDASWRDEAITPHVGTHEADGSAKAEFDADEVAKSLDVGAVGVEAEPRIAHRVADVERIVNTLAQSSIFRSHNVRI